MTKIIFDVQRDNGYGTMVYLPGVLNWAPMHNSTTNPKANMQFTLGDNPIEINVEPTDGTFLWTVTETVHTSGGTSEVTQEVYDTFMLQKESIEATQELQAALNSLPAENIPGEDQSIVVITLANSEITATVDEEDLFWDASTGEWKAVSTV